MGKILLSKEAPPIEFCKYQRINTQANVEALEERKQKM